MALVYGGGGSMLNAFVDVLPRCRQIPTGYQTLQRLQWRVRTESPITTRSMSYQVL